MYQSALKQIGYGVLYGILFLLFFHAMQGKLYEMTMAHFSGNTETQNEGQPNQQMVKLKRPFAEITEDRFRIWDAPLYKSIRDNMYRMDTGESAVVRPAFFPLFPMIWRASGLDYRGISVLNYLIFVLSLTLLSFAVIEDPARRMLMFVFAMSLPQLIFYMIPYTESIFLLTGSLAFFGLMRNRPVLWWISLFAMGMSRPATFFVIGSLALADSYFFFRSTNKLKYLLDSVVRVIPLGLGYFCAICFQYFYTHSWKALFIAQAHRNEGHWQMPVHISDWSVEGFGMSTFAICFICVPMLIYFIIKYLRAYDRQERYSLGSLFAASVEVKKDYLFSASGWYMIFMMVFIMFYKGGGLQSFSRYIFASPMFYAVLFLVPQPRHIRVTLRIWFACMLALFGFLAVNTYGDNRLRFEFEGMYQLIIAALILIVMSLLPRKLQYIPVIGLAAINLVWTAYMFNTFLRHGWIFT